MGVIYLVTNTITGRKYVGKTSQGIRKRWNKHVVNALKGTRRVQFYLHKSIRKYGPESFTLQQIGQFADDATLAVAEQLFIAELNTRAPQGYNLTDGGEGCVGRSISTETRQKMSRARKGKPSPLRGRKMGPLSENHRAAISLSLMGRAGVWAGKSRTFSPEHRARLADAGRQRKLPLELRAQLKADWYINHPNRKKAV